MVHSAHGVHEHALLIWLLCWALTSSHWHLHHVLELALEVLHIVHSIRGLWEVLSIVHLDFAKVLVSVGEGASVSEFAGAV